VLRMRNREVGPHVGYTVAITTVSENLRTEAGLAFASYSSSWCTNWARVSTANLLKMLVR